MLKLVFISIIIGVAVWTTRAIERECDKEDLELELKKYIRLESWQQLFTRHFKFIINQNGDILSGTKRLKFNTIIHNALYGCDHDRDDEVDDCPNILRGSIKSCKHGIRLRSAMFRAARCVFVESSVKHVVLSDALLDTYPMDKLDTLTADADRPIREFGETIVNILSTIGHGETGGLGELMALNLYLNNVYGTVFMHTVPAEPVTSAVDFRVARDHVRRVHATIVEKLYAFWDTWCSDRNIVEQYRAKYANETYGTVLTEIAENVLDAEDTVRGINVSGTPVDLDVTKAMLTDFADTVAASGTMPEPVADDMRLKSFEASFEFDPRALYAYHADAFRTVYACFYWATITHLRLAVQIMDAVEARDVRPAGRTYFMVQFAKFARPLAVFDDHRPFFAAALSPDASANVDGLRTLFRQVVLALRQDGAADTMALAKPMVAMFAAALDNDMGRALDVRGPEIRPGDRDYRTAFRLMRANYRWFCRLVSAVNRHRADLANFKKLKKYMFFLTDVVGFDYDGTSNELRDLI